MTLPASIRVNVRVPFPTLVLPGGYVTVTKANGVWTVGVDYRDLAESETPTGTQIIALQDSVTGAFSYIPAQALAPTPPNAYRVITSPGSVTVLSSDTTLLLNKSSSGSSSIQLPQSSTRGGVPLTVKDLTGDANTNNITFVPASGESIDGFSASAAITAGVAVIDVDRGWKTLYPLQSGGWYTL